MVVSVVVPIYKTERYLERCIDSICNQTYSQLEIILVDDGSPDNCPDICDKWQKKDSRIRVIHKQNAGLGYARNSGLDIATGEYICFFDSDDYISPETIEKCISVAKRDHSEIVYFGNDCRSDNGMISKIRIPSPPKDLFVGEEIVTLLVPQFVSHNAATGENWNLLMSAWCAVYSTNLIRRADWRFVSEREYISEDYYSLLQLYPHVERISFIREAFYHYTENFTSLSRVYRPDRFQKIKDLAIAMDDIANVEGMELEKPLTTQFIVQVRAAMKQIVASKEPWLQKRNRMLEVLNDPYFRRKILSFDDAAEGLGKKALHFAMRKRWMNICWLMLYARNLRR